MPLPSIHHWEFNPPEELKDIINCFWYDKINFGEQLSGFEVVPDGYAEIIFYFGSSCSISNNGVLQPLPSPFIIGLLNRPIHFFSEDHLQIIAIRCYPWTVFDLLVLPSGKDGVRTFDHPIAGLQSALEEYINAGKTEEAIALVSQYCMNSLPDVSANSMLFKAGAAIRDANGTVPVNQIAESAHTTVRTLERNFKQSSGHTVKDVSGLIRFEQARNQLWLDPGTNLAALAHELGYADQSHLSREFKRYSGSTPAAFARKAKNEQQDLNDDFVAFVQS